MAETAVRGSLSRPFPAALLRLAPLPLLFVLVLVVSTLFGSASIPKTEVVHILFARLGLYRGPMDWPTVDSTIIWDIRVPEVLAAALVGGALGVAGALFQAVLRNPLADPYVIGTSAGAQLGVTLALVLPWQIAAGGFGSMQVFAFAGAVGTILIVYALARTGGRTPVVTLLLAGFVISSFLISATSLLMQMSGKLDEVTRWTLGGIALDSPNQLAAVAPIVIAGICLSFVLAPRLDVILLGEEPALHLGLRVEALKLGSVVLASLLTALAVTLAGVIAFVGLVVPHTIRLLYGPSHRTLIPAAAVGGAIFLMLADLIARVAIPPTPLPLGVVTAVIGAPFFLHLLRRARHDYAL